MKDNKKHGKLRNISMNICENYSPYKSLDSVSDNNPASR